MLLLAFLAGGGEAFAAKKRVVVLGFSGPQAGKAEAAVVATVKKKNTVVSAGQYSKAQKRLKIKKLTAKNVAKIAADIQVDAIVSGAIKRKGAKWSLTVVVREGKSGKVAGSTTIPLRAPRIDARAKQDIGARVPALIAKTKPLTGGSEKKRPPSDDEEEDEEVADDEEDEVAVADDEEEEEEEEAEEEEEPPPKKKVAKAKKPAKKPAKRPPPEPSDDEEVAAGDDEEVSEEDEKVPGIDDEETDVAALEDDDDAPGSSVRKRRRGDDDDGGLGGEPRLARHAGLDLTVGMSAVGRTLAFTVRSGLAMNQQPNGYEGAIVPGGLVAVELYPMSFGKAKGGLAGLGLTAVFDRVFVLKSRYGAQEFNTTQQRFGVGVNYRLNTGSKPTSPTFHFGIGYNQLSFVIDNGATPIGLPDTVYTYLDPGAGMRLPLGERFAFNLEAKFMLVLETGEFGNNQNYGQATVLGLDSDAGLEFRPVPRMPLRLGFRYQRVAYDFAGSTGQQTVNRDGDPASQDVGGAVDSYMGAYVAAGYLF